jgi:hypothetical protein
MRTLRDAANALGGELEPKWLRKGDAPGNPRPLADRDLIFIFRPVWPHLVPGWRCPSRVAACGPVVPDPGQATFRSTEPAVEYGRMSAKCTACNRES